MNSYERYMGMVRGEQVDCVPRIPILMHFAAAYVGATYAEFAGQAEVMTRANLRLVEDFGFDQLDIMSDPWREASAFGAELQFLDETVPRCLHAPLADGRDLSLLATPDPAASPRLANAVAVVRAYAEAARGEYSITGWVEGPAAEAADLRGVMNLMTDLYDDETFCGELMDVCIETGAAYARAQVAAGADTIGVGDAIASQISPDMYERLVLPRERRLFAAIRKAGALVRLHICGDINHLIPMIATLEVDILDCDWMVDMPRARRLMGEGVTLTGNLDPVNAVMKSTPERIRAGFRELYAQVGDPYFVNAGCEIPAGTPEENLRAVCEPIPAA